MDGDAGPSYIGISVLLFSIATQKYCLHKRGSFIAFMPACSSKNCTNTLPTLPLANLICQTFPVWPLI